MTTLPVFYKNVSPSVQLDLSEKTGERHEIALGSSVCAFSDVSYHFTSSKLKHLPPEDKTILSSLLLIDRDNAVREESQYWDTHEKIKSEK